jgi:hypothetical protein
MREVLRYFKSNKKNYKQPNQNKQSSDSVFNPGLFKQWADLLTSTPKHRDKSYFKRKYYNYF